MSHVKSEYDFLQNQCVMIYGQNLTDEGSDSNGSGKSVILEGITLALTGEVSRDIDRNEFINEDADSTNVRLFLSNKQGSVNTLVIDRTLHRTKAEKIILIENGITNDELTSVNEANARIYELIGLTKFDLMNFFLIGQEKRFSFLTAGDSEKKDIISRFSNTNFILDKIEALKARSKTDLEEIKKHESKIEQIEAKVELLDEQIKNFNDEFKKRNKERIDRSKERISTAKERKDEAEQRKVNLDRKIKDLQKDYDKFNGSVIKTDTWEAKITDAEKSIKEVKKELSDSEGIERHLLSLLSDKIQCPKCEHEFILGNDIDLTIVPTLLEESRALIKACEKSLEKFNLKLTKFKTELKKAEKEKAEQKERKNELEFSKGKLKNIIEQINDYQSQIEEHEKDLKKIKESKKENSDLIDKKTQKSNLEGSRGEIEENIKPLRVSHENNEFWIHHFGKKGFMTFLTNKSIKSIEGITNSYLKRINTDLQVEIEGYTTLKSGGLSDKINVSIVRSGKRVAKFNRYSGGEKGRIVIANILGLQKLINMACPNGGLNFLGLDEVFEGLDITGQVEVTKILEEIEMTTLVVSHRSKPIGVKNELIIQKINGISTIKQNGEEGNERKTKKDGRKSSSSIAS